MEIQNVWNQSHVSLSPCLRNVHESLIVHTGISRKFWQQFAWYFLTFIMQCLLLIFWIYFFDLSVMHSVKKFPWWILIFIFENFFKHWPCSKLNEKCSKKLNSWLRHLSYVINAGHCEKWKRKLCIWTKILWKNENEQCWS